MQLFLSGDLSICGLDISSSNECILFGSGSGLTILFIIAGLGEGLEEGLGEGLADGLGEG